MPTETIDLADALREFDRIHGEIQTALSVTSKVDWPTACKRIDSLEEDRQRLIHRVRKQLRIAPLESWLAEMGKGKQGVT